MSKDLLRYGSLACALVGALVASTSFGCDQPKPKCNVGRGGFAAKYTVVSGPPSCADRRGDEIGLNAYNPVGEGGRPDLERGSIAIQSLTLGTLSLNVDGTPAADPDPTHKPYALGDFAESEPGDDNFCTVPTFAPAIQNLGDLPADEEAETEAQPATRQQYEWRNFRVYVTAGATGTQFTAELTITTDGVACGYNVTAMYPYVDCSVDDPADATRKIPSDPVCGSEPDPAAGRSTGSGINPDFPVRCDPDLLACFLTSGAIATVR